MTRAMVRLRFLNGFRNFHTRSPEMCSEVRHLTKSVAATIVATAARIGTSTLKNYCVWACIKNIKTERIGTSTLKNPETVIHSVL